MTERLPSLKSREVIRALQRAGFVVSRTSGSHCRLVHGTDPARQVTVPQHAGRDLKRGTIQGILRQAELSAEEFNALLRE
jgi:predicted RNA binding protein YcfA (HicA-like mRNA interferase family)